MAQARRKPSRARRRSIGGGWAGGNGWSGIGLLLAGAVSGALAMQLWHGGGAGLRQVFDFPRFSAPDSAGGGSAGGETPAGDAPAGAAADDPAAKPATDFTFFTVLPDLEVLAPSAPPPESPAATESTGESTGESSGESPSSSSATAAAAPAETVAGRFMLQAGSYRSVADADRLKATLALNGMLSSIQKVTIQGRGDFYRVRLGPFPTYQAMVDIDRQLSRAGIKALRLKMKSGNAGNSGEPGESGG
ncbi:MAG: SPOR domain-containing protein [Gammaproteobacteria bacterium]|nr:SPOR domain-containing protein [Gammaproteobacteria bacterium]